MKRNLKSTLSSKTTLLILSIVSVVLGAFAFIAGGFADFLLPAIIADLVLPANIADLVLPAIIAVLAMIFAMIYLFLVLPAIIAVLAMIYLFDKEKRYAIASSIILVAFNIAGFALGINYTLFSLTSIIVALLISSAYINGQSKSDAAFISSIVIVGVFVVSLIASAMISLNSFDLDAVMKYYIDIYNDTRDASAGLAEKYYLLAKEMMPELYEGLEQDLSLDDFKSTYDYFFASTAIAGVLISGFATVGISMKLFGFVVGKCSEDNGHIRNWRFALSTPYAFFYLILIVAYIFSMYNDNLFAVCVTNLYYIFQLVFAYVGFKTAISELSKKMKPALSFLVVSAASLVFISFATQIYATIGVISTIRFNRTLPSEMD